MHEYMLNPLSPHSQCTNEDSAINAIKNVIECLDHLEPLLTHGRGIIYFDERLEEKTLLSDTALSVTIARLMNTRNAQFARKWYLYRRRLTRVQPPDIFVNISSADGSCNNKVAGNVSHQIFNKDLCSVSFGGARLTESTSLTISSAIKDCVARNYHSALGLRASLPFYKASSKHRMKKYFDRERSEWVAPMTLPADLAQQVLLLAVKHEDDFFGVHRPSEKIVRFKKTIGNEYHGFEVEIEEVPNKVLAALFPNK